MVVRGWGEGDLHPWAQGYPVAASLVLLSGLGFLLSLSVLSLSESSLFPSSPTPPLPSNTQPLLSFITVVVAQLRSEDLQALL